MVHGHVAWVVTAVCRSHGVGVGESPVGADGPWPSCPWNDSAQGGQCHTPWSQLNVHRHAQVTSTE